MRSHRSRGEDLNSNVSSLHARALANGVARHRRGGRRSFDRPRNRSFDTGKRDEEGGNGGNGRESARIRAARTFPVQARRGGSDESSFLEEDVSSSLEFDRRSFGMTGRTSRSSMRSLCDLERPAVSSCRRLSWLVRPAMTATPRASNETATSVRAHARPSPRSSTQGLLLCFPAHRLACTQCHFAGTKPATRTPASSSAATPAFPDVRVQSRMTREQGREFSARFENGVHSMALRLFANRGFAFGYLPSNLRRLLESPFIHDTKIALRDLRVNLPLMRK